jgi:MYXO-CTERM domain-containing protein
MRLLLLSVSVWCVAACEPADSEPVLPVARPIVGGQLAGACQWPTTVLLNDAGCSGTLIHPSIIVTAAHCGTKMKNAILGETRGAAARTLAIEYCRVFQDENGPSASDYAFCKLRQPVTDVPIVPVLMGCEREVLKVGTKVIVAGFGETGKSAGYGTKRWVETTVNRLGSATRAIQVGGMGKAPCFGDSGGPAFVQLPDGSWRVFGIDSAGLADSCDAGDLMAQISDAVAWIEEQSKIDVTPCHDADGTWNPSTDCRGFSLLPDMSGRSWSNGCAEPSLSPPLFTCGAAYGDDGGAPRGDAGTGDGRGAVGDATADARPLADARAASRDVRTFVREAAAPEPDADEPAPVPGHASKGCSCDSGGRGAGGGGVLGLLGLLIAGRARRRRGPAATPEA